MTATGQNSQRGFGLPLERVFQDLRQPRLPFRDPTRIVLANGLLIVPEQVSDVGDGHRALQEDPCEGVSKSVRRRRFFERSRDVERGDFASRRRQMLVMVSRRSDRATMNGRSPYRSARAWSRSRSQSGT
jgi:hypothetical protein